jgi:hypothetical protein
MEKFIEDYVHLWPQYQTNKVAYHIHYGLLQPLELAYFPWNSISMHFILELPVSNQCSSVWVFIDWYTTMAPFFPLTDGERKATDLVRIFLKELWRFHGQPSNIVSDRHSRFTFVFWSLLVKAVDIKLKIYSPFYPQTNRQTEIVNKMLKCYLRNYCKYKQDNWFEILAMANYAYNNSLTTTTGMLPFIANFVFRCWINWSVAAEAKNLASREYIHWMTRVHALCRKDLEQAQATMWKYHDRTANEPPKHSVGNLVMLNRKNLKTRGPSRKLDVILHGPFKVSRVLLPITITLELSSWWCIHIVFYVSLIKSYWLSTNPTRYPPELVSASQQNELGYNLDGYEYKTVDEVEEIMGSQYCKEWNQVL